jgi:hypothetical protein
MEIQEVKDTIEDYNSEAILWDDIDGGIIGIGKQHGGKYVVVYDRDKSIESLATKFFYAENNQYDNGNITWDQAYQDALEWFEYNIECAYVGENTPIIMQKL